MSTDGFDWPELLEIPTRNGFGVGLGLKVGRSEFGGVFHTFPFGYSQQPGDSIHWVGGGDTIAGSVGGVTRYIGAGLYYHFELLRMGRLVSISPGVALGYWGDYVDASITYRVGTMGGNTGTDFRSVHFMKLYLRTELAIGKVALFNDQVLTVGQDGSGWHMHFGASLDLTGLVKGPPSGS
ncbi:MAG: hypothetical protein GF331_04760 [Chitinivibrionales bacterium]|nr:hypothetical protein [Chitinivibrionales bacterium]